MHLISSFKMLQCTFGPYTNEDTPEESKLYSKVIEKKIDSPRIIHDEERLFAIEDMLIKVIILTDDTVLSVLIYKHSTGPSHIQRKHFLEQNRINTAT